MAAFAEKLWRQQAVSLLPVGSCLSRTRSGTGAFPRVSKGRRQTSPPSPLAARPISEPSLTARTTRPVDPAAPGAGGYVLIDEPAGLLSVSTNYDKRLHVCGISQCRCVKLTLMNPFVYFSCCCCFFCECLLGYKDMNVS